jgi:GntR family transcriptional regulator
MCNSVIAHYNTYEGQKATEPKLRERGCVRVLQHRLSREWNDSQPIYRQLRDRVVHMILDGVLKEGDSLPSVRNVAAEYRINPLTVLKAYQELADDELVEKRRGLGMFVNTGARDLLLKGERQKFLNEHWPRIHATIQRLGLTPKELLDAAARHSAKTGPASAQGYGSARAGLHGKPAEKEKH